jgi:uncharacterized protein
MKYIHLLFAASLLLAGCAKEPKKEFLDIKQVPFTNVKINDKFWAPRIEKNRTVSIPSAFKQSELNGRFDNFALAAGLIKGEQKGDFPFDDTDPYKIIEGASYSLAVEYDAKLDAYLDSVINLIAKAQAPDGYLYTVLQNNCTRLSGWFGSSRWEKINSHELYNCGHLYEAAVAHFQATGKRTLLDVAIKNADLVCKDFGPNQGQVHRPSGHPIVEMGLAKLYKVTGDQKYLDQARYFVDEAGRCTDGHKPNAYSQDHKPVLQQDEITGHAVRAGYFYSGVADVASLQKDTLLFDAVKRIWDNMTSKKLYITGGIGSRGDWEGFGPNYDLGNQTAYCETCAAISNVYWNQRMFLSTGDAKYIDVLERALYNGVISGVSLSGDRFFYDNPLESNGQHERQPWFGCACCPSNATRFMASIPGYVYATRKENLYVNLYIGSQSVVQVNGKDVAIKQETNYPWDGKIEIDVNPDVKQIIALHLRIPGWERNEVAPGGLYHYVDYQQPKYIIKVNKTVVRPNMVDGYAVIKRTWKRGDNVEIEMDMPIRQVNARDDVSADLGKMALERGPIVYCLEKQDQETDYLFNLYISQGGELSATFDPTLLGGVMTITGKAFQRNESGDKEVNFKAIPYSTWNNRGKDQMMVWIPDTRDAAVYSPKNTIASRALWSYACNDQFEPKRSNDLDKPYAEFKSDKEKGVSVLEYNFKEPETMSSVEVYWCEFDNCGNPFSHYDAPASWKLFYKEGENWKEVQTNDAYGVALDRYNKVSFKTVKSTGLRIEATPDKDGRVALLEWKVNE